MSTTGVKFTKSGIPVPLDAFGNEMCLLFIKYGRCRFKKKCKKSHWTPPLPDEEYPELPPLPLSPPPPSFDSCQSNGRITTTQLSDEHEQNPLATKSSCTKKKCAAYLGDDSIGWTSIDGESPNSQGFIASDVKPLNQDVLPCTAPDRTFEVLQPLNIQQDIQNDVDLAFLCTANIRSMSPTFISNIQGATKEKEIKDSESSTVERFSSVDTNLTKQELQKKVVDKIVQDIYTGKYRFYHVYHPNREAKGNDWGRKSNVDQKYKQYGAYYDNVNKKLQVQHQPRSKTEKKRLKLLRRAHWNSCQVLKARLNQIPPSYSLNVNFYRVNFNRLRPYFYLLVQQCFFCGMDPTESQWRPTSFSCLVTDTLIAFFTKCNITPLEAEKKMQEWGARPVRVRQCVSHMWNIIVKSSLSTSAVAQEVLNCEKQVFAKKLCAVDYAYACSLAAPLMKANVDRSTPTIPKSVRQGIQAAKKTSLLQQKQKHIKTPRASENIRVKTKTTAVRKTSTTLGSGKGLTRTEGVTLKKKIKTRRSRQLSLLDEQGKKDLEKRCKTILDNATGCI